ncbi:helix-turn-helix domain-containing protein [Desulfovibrio sp. OttesenSCG-928-G15]|nr:helix-turn-helix domain-containing protein [Desulfovibrio sp. OttesenSCG-928-G15]
MTKEIRLSLGAKRAKVAHLIHYEMGVRGFTGKRLARLLGCTPQNVSRVINGQSHSGLVLDGLRKLGVAEKLLFDPRKSGVSVEGVKDCCVQEVVNG